VTDRKTLDQMTSNDLDQLHDALDGAYRERAQLLALLAALHPSVIAPAPDVAEDGWQILYLQIGGLQASWHIAPRDAELYTHVEHVPTDDRRAQWDGHTTEQKYEHIGQHAARLHADAHGRVETPRPPSGEPAPAEQEPHAGLTVQPYRRADDGSQKWVFRCWGTDTCDGWLSLDHDTERWAEIARDRHVAEEHAEPVSGPAATQATDDQEQPRV